jgi:hypothetical protein
MASGSDGGTGGAGQLDLSAFRRPGLLQRGMRRAAGWIGVRLKRHLMAEELWSLDDRSLADIGLRRDEIPRLVRSYPESTERLRRAMRRIGIDPQALETRPALRRAIERSCATCYYRRECRRWLEHKGTWDSYRKFCPNAENFDALPLRRAVRASASRASVRPTPR